MANTNPIKYNFQAGTLGVSLAATDTTINFGQVPAFPTLNNAASGDFVPVSLISAGNLVNSEIVYVTGYTAGNSTGQISRGMETAIGAHASTTWAAGAIWEAAPTGSVEIGPAAVNIAGNTSGATANVSAGTLTLAGGNNVTLSQASNAITISAFNQSAQTQNVIDLTIGGNTTGTSVLVSSGTLTLAGGNNITLSQGNNNAITISQLNNALSMYPVTPISTVMSNVPNQSGSVGAAGNTSLTTISLWVMPMPVDTPLVYNEIRIPALISMTTTNTTIIVSGTAGMTLGLYTKNGANLSLVSSWSNKQLLSMQSTNVSGNGSITWQASFGGSATQHTTALTVSTASNTNAAYWTGITGSKMIPLMTGSTASLSENMYYAVVAVSLSTGGQNGTAFSNWWQSLGQASVINLTHLQDQGLTSTGGTTGIYPLLGLASAQMRTDTVWPLSIATANITTSSNNASFVNRSLYCHFVMRTT